MQSQNRFFDDLAKVLNGLAGTVAGVGREAEAGARERAKEWFGGMDFVSREEFDAVKEMAATARAEADALKKRVEELEKGKPAAKRPAARKTAARKPAARKPAASKTAAKPAAKKPDSSK
ncbi:BMFP domain-containing protein YqiC [Parasphingorhabdus marina DSM 22363]|uniref:BMFP domain-containing protein YqiC n=1 Tax=Parasphingorhabdus marina DSM 22363 TaxID=1123272 RepID=A0A1N6D548_9SPHN|nr:accessory factor UbiK family protein [Parasphingorhabdus marina]SIN65905.1 BMFP domain-containing protein YqiC [Parasphingorhabdus marina DSM 22363]